MRRIKILKASVANKIAAGEVIQGPYNVVKELIENSLDAQATIIEIKIEKWGMKKISVLDNGVGMDKKDIKMCYKKYATSKISKISDLQSLGYLGFRGEALYAISSISTVTIMSKTKESAEGFKIKVSNSRLIEQTPIAMVTGTKVTVENLFKMFPVKRKYVYSKTKETKKIIELISAYALAYPKVRFILKTEKRLLLDIKETSIKKRLRYIYKDENQAFFIPIKYKSKELNIHGYIGYPQISSFSKEGQIILINKRVINDKKISKLIKNTYGNLIEAKKNPQFALIIDINPKKIDINIHPSKEEIKILEEKTILNLIEDSIRHTLKKHNLTYTYKFKPQHQKDFEETYNYINSKVKEEQTLWNIKKIQEEEIIQINKTYLIAKIDKSLFIFDQHATHEKILYNEIKNNLKLKKQKSLKKPLVITTTIKTTLKINQYIDTLKKIGITIEPFGKNTFKISKKPKYVPNNNIESFIEEIIEKANQGIKIENITQTHTVNKVLSFIACKNAIKAGEYLTKKERKNLINKALSTKETYTCPHGRPAYIKISLKELDKMFKRI